MKINWMTVPTIVMPINIAAVPMLIGLNPKVEAVHSGRKAMIKEEMELIRNTMNKGIF